MFFRSFSGFSDQKLTIPVPEIKLYWRPRPFITNIINDP